MTLSGGASVGHDGGSVVPDRREHRKRVEQPAPPELLISPELVLVDPELAAIARASLPDIPDAVRAARPAPVFAEATPAASPAPFAIRDDAERVPAPEPATAGRASARRRAALVVALPLAFAAGGLIAIHGLDLHWARASQTVEPAPNGVVNTAIADGNATGRTPEHTRRRQPTRSVAQPRTGGVEHGHVGGRRAEPGVRVAANVLGVVVTPTQRGVKVVWRAPRGSARVIVVRYRGQRRAGGIVVYRGRRSSYTDSRVKPGTYAYLIRNYDRRGRGSSGVTSVVVVK